METIDRTMERLQAGEQLSGPEVTNEILCHYVGNIEMQPGDVDNLRCNVSDMLDCREFTAKAILKLAAHEMDDERPRMLNRLTVVGGSVFDGDNEDPNIRVSAIVAIYERSTDTLLTTDDGGVGIHFRKI
jgi:hypothetical protein